MNYRHAYHAGNFADVFKHVILSRCIAYLRRKEAPFRVIDTHAGIGLYDLMAPEAQKTGEWQEGIARLLAAQPGPQVGELLRDYLRIVREMAPMTYPGSPMISRRMLRRQDRLSLFELHDADAATLAKLFAGDFQCRVSHLDGWLVPGAHLPPKERRGLVLIDPPFEKEGEFERLVEALRRGVRRWPGGTFLLWYPLKHRAAVSGFVEDLVESGVSNLLRTELTVAPANPEPVLHGCGMIIRNPPYVLLDELTLLLAELVAVMAPQGGSWSASMLVAE